MGKKRPERLKVAKTTVRLTTDLNKRLGYALVDRDMSGQQAFIEAIEKWLGQEYAPAAQSDTTSQKFAGFDPGSEKIYELVRKVLHSRDRDAVRTLLTILNSTIRLLGHDSTEGIDVETEVRRLIG